MRPWVVSRASLWSPVRPDATGSARTVALTRPGALPSRPTRDPESRRTPVAGSPSAPSRRSIFAASFIGTSIEWYDYYIFGTAAALVFGTLFFPQFSSVAGTLAAFGTFAVGFIARPLGAAVIGHYGDRIGRKAMLVLTLLLTGGATALIGLLPTYAAIGVGAPLLLVSPASAAGLRRRRGVGRRGPHRHRARLTPATRGLRQLRAVRRADRRADLQPRLPRRGRACPTRRSCPGAGASRSCCPSCSSWSASSSAAACRTRRSSSRSRRSGRRARCRSPSSCAATPGCSPWRASPRSHRRPSATP